MSRKPVRTKAECSYCLSPDTMCASVEVREPPYHNRPWVWGSPRWVCGHCRDILRGYWRYHHD